MNKNDLIKKIKFMETALEQGEKLNLLCSPWYNMHGDYVGLKLFFMSAEMSNDVVFGDNNYYEVLTYDDISSKETNIGNYIKSFCTCDPLDKLILGKQCECKLPKKEEAEQDWYQNIIAKLEKRSEELKSLLNLKD